MARSLVRAVSISTVAVGLAAVSGMATVPRPPPAARRTASVVSVASHAPADGAWWVGELARVYDEVERRSARLARAERTRVARVILEESRATMLDPLLVLAVIRVESGFDARAVSRAGALGLMQLMPPTMHEEVRRSRLASGDPLDPVANVRAGVRYLARLIGAFGDVELALMAYNAGPQRIRGHLRAGGVPKRFFAYPRAVLRRRAQLSPPSELAALARSASHVRLAAAHRSGGAPAATGALGLPLAAAALDRIPVPPLRGFVSPWGRGTTVFVPAAPAAARALALAWGSAGPIAGEPLRSPVPLSPPLRWLFTPSRSGIRHLG